VYLLVSLIVIETFGMDPLPVESGSLACLLRATWIQQALSNPCALHTTLYAASAHLDAFRGAKSSNMTLYHHTIALRLLQERINDPDEEFSESLMACVAPLVFFSVRHLQQCPREPSTRVGSDQFRPSLAIKDHPPSIRWL
jgi:hypothetical protein